MHRLKLHYLMYVSLHDPDEDSHLSIYLHTRYFYTVCNSPMYFAHLSRTLLMIFVERSSCLRIQCRNVIVVTQLVVIHAVYWCLYVCMYYIYCIYISIVTVKLPINDYSSSRETGRITSRMSGVNQPILLLVLYSSRRAKCNIGFARNTSGNH